MLSNSNNYLEAVGINSILGILVFTFDLALLLWTCRFLINLSTGHRTRNLSTFLISDDTKPKEYPDFEEIKVDSGPSISGDAKPLRQDRNIQEAIHNKVKKHKKVSEMNPL